MNRQADGTVSEKGRELVISDGTEAGTVFYDLNVGSASSNPQIVGILNGYLYFAAQNAIYKTNGGEPIKVTDWAYSGLQILGYSDQKVYLTKIDETRGTELWIANVTTNEVSLVKDILPGTGSSLVGHSYQVRLMVGDKFVFTAYKSANEGNLYSSGGTTGTTVKLAEKVLQYKVIAEDAIYFTQTNTNTTNLALWYSDGTVAPCCNTIGRNIPVGNVNNYTIKEIWNNDKMKEIRDGFKKNKPSKACRICIEESQSEVYKNIQ